MPRNATHNLGGISSPLRVRVPCLGYFPHPPSASNIAYEIQVCKVEKQDVIITTLFSEFNKNQYKNHNSDRKS